MYIVTDHSNDPNYTSEQFQERIEAYRTALLNHRNTELESKPTERFCIMKIVEDGISDSNWELSLPFNGQEEAGQEEAGP